MSETIIRTTTKLAMTIVERYVNKGDTVVDATAGNVNDTLALANLVGASGKVYAFDIQEEAIKRTGELLAESPGFLNIGNIEKETICTANRAANNVVLICGPHEKMSFYIQEKGRISAVVFNLGYLPSGNKNIHTTAESTIKAIKESLEILKKGGIVSIVMYPGTEAGKNERDAIMRYVKLLPFKKYHVCRCDAPNQTGAPPEILWIETK